MGNRKVFLAALVLVVAMTGCNTSRHPVETFTVRFRDCPWCGQPMVVYMGNTGHVCEVWEVRRGR